MNKRKKPKTIYISPPLRKLLRTCSNCGEDLTGRSGHFVPPSLGDPGFFICKKKEQ